MPGPEGDAQAQGTALVETLLLDCAALRKSSIAAIRINPSMGCNPTMWINPSMRLMDEIFLFLLQVI
jgi:hypothetical protein